MAVMVNSSDLAGEVVLVTRPAAQQGALCAALETVGARCVSLPALVIEAIGETDPTAQSIRNVILELDQFQHLIFISTNAVKQGMEWIENYWPQFPAGVAVYAIGEATSRALADRGVMSSCAGTHTVMDSEALLRLPALQVLSGQRCLILRGVGGREYLGQQLAARGARVSYGEVYRRLCPVYPAGKVAALFAGGLTKVVVNSGETMDNLRQLAAADGVTPALLALPIVVPSHRVAEQARCQGFQQILLSHNASVDAVVSCLLTAASHQEPADITGDETQ